MCKVNNIDEKLKELILKLNNSSIDKMIEFIRDNRENINFYFFIGSGILKYIDDGETKLKLWKDMAKEEFKGLNIEQFIDFVTLDIKYEKNIEETNLFELSNWNYESNSGLRNIWNNLSSFIIKTHKKNKLNIITTNHCDSINKYFKTNPKQYHINNINEFFQDNFSVFKIHNFNENEYIYKIEHYTNYFHDNLSDVYKEFSRYSNNNSNLYFIFGSSYSELHIQVLIRKISSNKNNKIVWIRSYDLSKEFNNDVKLSLEKFMQQYEENSHLIIWTYKEDLSRNNVLELINSKIENLFKNGVGIRERVLFNSPIENSDLNNPKYLINAALNEYDSSNDKKRFLNDLLLRKDYSFICWLLLCSNSFDVIFKWYIENIDKFKDTIIDINWFISTIQFNEEKYNKYADLLMDKCINMDMKEIKSNDIIKWIELIDISNYNYEWIITKIWNTFTNIEKTSDWYHLYNDEIKNKDIEKDIEENIYNFIIKFLDKKINDKIGFISTKTQIFYLFKLKNIINRNIDVIDVILKVYKKSFDYFLTHINLINGLEIGIVNNVLFIRDKESYTKVR